MSWEGYFFTWLICGAIAAEIANSKGNDWVVGGCLGFLFEPIGIIVAAVMPQNESVLSYHRRAWEAKQVNQGHLRQCPYCLSVVSPVARVCRVCGRDLPPATISTPGITPLGKIVGNHCTNCGAGNPPEYEFCGNCGNPLAPPKTSDQEIRCSRCGTANAPDFKFCGSCGASLKLESG